MFNSWLVITRTINVSGGEAEVTARKDTEKEAMDLFYNNLSSYGTNPSTKACQVIVVKPNGDFARFETIDNTACESAPITE